VNKEYLFDTSALLALIQREQRGEILLERGGGGEPPIIDRAAIHTVQVAETVKKLVDKGLGEDQCREWIEALDLEVLTGFELGEALNTARFCPKEMSLSLGDRVCLSVANARNLVAVTTEQQWKTVADGNPQLNVQVMLLVK
jgi:ribonuclease VapC